MDNKRRIINNLKLFKECTVPSLLIVEYFKKCGGQVTWLLKEHDLDGIDLEELIDELKDMKDQDKI